jgi:hypothetical protein
MRSSSLSWFRLARPALALAFAAALQVLAPARAEETAASPEEMQRAKAALAEGLKREQAAEQGHGSSQAAVILPLPPPAEPAVVPPSPPAEVAAAPPPPPPVSTVAAPRATADAEPAAATTSTVPKPKPQPQPAMRAGRETTKRHHVAHASKRDEAAARTVERRAAAHASRAAAAERKSAARLEARQRRAAADAKDAPVTTGSLPTRVPPRPTRAQPEAPQVPLALPASLAPQGLFASNEVSTYHQGLGWVRGTQETLRAFEKPMKARRGAPPKMVEACRDALAPLARAQGASGVYAAATGPSRPGRDGLEAPLEVRILYKGLTGTELRQARLSCTLDPAGRVVALSPGPAGR